MINFKMSIYRFVLSSGLLIFLTTSFAQTIHVSPTGNDANDGSINNPVLSFQRGADLAKAQNASVVEFEDGEYIFESTVVLDASYSGITFQAAAGATPVFSSLIQVTDWTPCSTCSNSNIMKATMPSGISHVRYLQDKQSDWLERSATSLFRANEISSVGDGCLECNWDDPTAQAHRKNIQYPADFVTPDWALASQYDLKQSTIQWLQEILPIESVNVNDRRIFTTIPASLEMRLDAGESPLVNNNWVLNSLEGIDTPGEWAILDGKIYLYPISGVSEIYVPGLTELIRVDAGGDGNTWAGAPVNNITFNGITFTGGDFYMMTENDITAQHDWAVVDQATALLRFRNVENMVVDNCTFTKSGGTGVRFDRYAQNNKVLNSHFSFLGRGAIRLMGRGPGYGDVNRDNEIAFNITSNTGLEKWTSASILIDQSSNNFIHHNYISNTFFTALILTAPRQIMFISQAENLEEPTGYLGREFHYFEVAQSILDEMEEIDDGALASYEAMNFVYNYNNRVEKNAFVDVMSGKGYLDNGYVYHSGAKRNTVNFLNYNYFFDSGNKENNNAVFYSDSDQDGCEYVGNMINGVQNGDNAPEPYPIFLAFADYPEGDEDQFPAIGNINIKGTTVINSTWGYEMIAGKSFTETGTVLNSSGGIAACLETYIEMYLTLCTDSIAGPKPFAGSQQMIDRLSSVITDLGGTLPDCGAPNSSTYEIAGTPVSIYPNPANEVLNINVNGQLNFQSTLYDLKGSIITRSTNTKQISIGTVPIGTYLLKIKDLKTGQLVVKKISVMR